ncbi:11-cis retinol dehydrogenase-like [Tropilaelaps mercedesae]|uniref:11-cis retinol dehydrogenase-like n=1 Tax=Tropilaelaps mercedesae TaxID=418985 RepID=A0A1V9X937_9ACAR|nr:11-cis retinol dehydrogenase-like [Tropilaelaps mercedesae]
MRDICISSSTIMTLLIIALPVVTIVAVWLVRRKQKIKNMIILEGTEYVLITGCDSGIGYTLARHLQKTGQKGFQVIASCVWPDGEAATRLKALGVKILRLDFTDGDLKEFSAEVKATLGESKLHAFINNAGVCIMGEFDWLTEEQLSCIFDVNLGAIPLHKYLMDRIITDQTRIINVTSVNGTLPYPGLAAYCATKYALEAFTDVLAMELPKFGVHVIKFRLGDFSKVTSIMAGQKKHADLMWNNFSAKQRARYDYFHDYQRVIHHHTGRLSMIGFGDLLDCFDDALLSIRPRLVYTPGNTIYLAALRILSWIPESWRNSLIGWVFEKGLKYYGVQVPPHEVANSNTYEYSYGYS